MAPRLFDWSAWLQLTNQLLAKRKEKGKPKQNSQLWTHAKRAAAQDSPLTC